MSGEGNPVYQGADDVVQRMLLFSPPQQRPKGKLSARVRQPTFDVVTAESGAPEDSTEEPRDEYSVDDFEKLEGKFSVYLRLKPLVGSKVSELPRSCIEVLDSRTIRTVPPQQQRSYNSEQFSFDKVFSDSATEAELYSSCVQPAVRRLIQGEPSLIFSYGISGSGKTHTIMNLLPQILNDLFRMISHDNNFSVTVSLLEVYNEKILDLIPMGDGQSREVLIQEGADGRLSVRGAREIAVGSALDAKQVFDAGIAHRTKAATMMNSDSSRSHAVYSIKLARLNSENMHLQEIARLSVVDLAGSERVSKTRTQGQLLTEAANINKSLMVLGRCFEALKRVSILQQIGNKTAAEKAAKICVPFRDSKITRMFQDRLSGGSKVIMIVNATQDMSEYGETIHVLRYGCLASQIDTTHTQQRLQQKQLLADQNTLVGLPGYAQSTLSKASAFTSAEGSAVNENSRKTLQDNNTKSTVKKSRSRGKQQKLVTEHVLPVESGQVALSVCRDMPQLSLQDIPLEFKSVMPSMSLDERDALELELRAEIADELAEQLHDYEKQISSAVQNERERLEELYERKLEIVLRASKSVHDGEYQQNLEAVRSVFDDEQTRLRNEYRRVRDELSASHAVCSALEHGAKIADSNLAKSRGEIDRLMADNASLQAQVQSLHSAIAEKVAASYEMQTQLQRSFEREKLEFTNQLTSAERRIAELVQENEQIAAQVLAAQAQDKSAQRRIASLEGCDRQLREQFDNEVASLKKVFSDVEQRLRSHSSDLQSELDAERKNVTAAQQLAKVSLAEVEAKWTAKLKTSEDSHKRTESNLTVCLMDSRSALSESEERVRALEAQLASAEEALRVAVSETADLRCVLEREKNERAAIEKRLEDVIRISAATAASTTSAPVNTATITATKGDVGDGVFSPTSNNKAKKRPLETIGDKLLRKFGKKQKHGEINVVVADTPSQDTRFGQTATILRGNIAPSVSGSGVSVQFTDMETVFTEAPSFIMSPRPLLTAVQPANVPPSPVDAEVPVEVNADGCALPDAPVPQSPMAQPQPESVLSELKETLQTRASRRRAAGVADIVVEAMSPAKAAGDTVSLLQEASIPVPVASTRPKRAAALKKKAEEPSAEAVPAPSRKRATRSKKLPDDALSENPFDVPSCSVKSTLPPKKRAAKGENRVFDPFEFVGSDEEDGEAFPSPVASMSAPVSVPATSGRKLFRPAEIAVASPEEECGGLDDKGASRTSRSTKRSQKKTRKSSITSVDYDDEKDENWSPMQAAKTPFEQRKRATRSRNPLSQVANQALKYD